VVTEEPPSPSAPAAGVSHVHRDDAASKLGMWIFLLTELVLFGGLFLAYSNYRSWNPDQFHHAAAELNVLLGLTNTFVLLTSSLTVALSVSAVRQGRQRHAVAFLTATLFLGCAFLVNKYFEWAAKIHHGIYPGSPAMLEREPGERLFFGLYYSMTGLHGVHVVVGVAVLGVMLRRLMQRRIHAHAFIALENSALYWHLVDIIWIFLLPLFYLAA
jgi:cytochrome c oxidase subunit 3